MNNNINSFGFYVHKQNTKTNVKKEEITDKKDKTVAEQNSAQTTNPDDVLTYMEQTGSHSVKHKTTGINPFAHLTQETIDRITAEMPKFDEMYEANLAAADREFGNLLSKRAKSRLALEQIN